MFKKCLSLLLSFSQLGIASVCEELETSSHRFSINELPVDLSPSPEAAIEIKNLIASLSDTPLSSHSEDECVYTIKEIVEAGKYLHLQDGSVWLIMQNDREKTKKWEPGQPLMLSYHAKNKAQNKVKFENLETKQEIWGGNEKKPASPCFILRRADAIFDSKDEFKLVISNGLILKGAKVNWKVREPVFVFHAPGGSHHIWNLNRNEVSEWQYLGNEKQGSAESFFNVEQLLNSQVLGQKEVIHKVSSVLLNCYAGMNDPKLPYGVFLFLGPTGVGKTELAKTITQALYRNQSHLIRFDMSQFISHSDCTRLIGSPPGYVDHQEGGQLTEAIKAKPRSVLLLDEMEKAHPSIAKAFLPVFDEGYIIDAKNTKIPCNSILFIMTGNVCSQEIAHLFNEGYSEEEVLRAVEPYIIQALSPELYNRATVLLFRPITREVMAKLVDQKLNELIVQLKNLKSMHLIVDQSVKEYLIKHGFHPTLGVRPLKRLIQNEVVAFISYSIVKEGIPEGSALLLSYEELDESWNLNWY